MNASELFNKNNALEQEPQDAPEIDSASILAEQRKVNLAREGLYLFLARSFKHEVDSEFLTMVAAVQPILERLASAQGGTELKKAAELLSTVSGKAAVLEGKERKQLLTDLAIEYASLFVNPGQQMGRERVLPWESGYFTTPPRMYGPPYHEVIEAFRMVGFEKPKEYSEPEDHIALELEFMAHLTRLTISGIDNGQLDFAIGYLKLQKEFLKDHLLRWVGKFSGKLMKNSEKRETDFYYALGVMLESFIKLDDQTLEQIAADLGKPSVAKREGQAANETKQDTQDAQGEEVKNDVRQFCTIHGRVTYTRGSVPLAKVKAVRATLPETAAEAITPSPASATIDSTNVRSATTDVAGSYELAELEPGTYEVTVSPPKGWNYVASPQTVKLEPGDVKTADFTLGQVPLQTILEGRVLDSDQKPAKDARLEDVICNNKLASATTDREGRYVFENVTPGKRFVRVNLGGHLSEVHDFTIEEGEKITLDFTLKKATHRIRGSVVNEEGKQLEATVQLFEGTPLGSLIVQKVQTTNENGSFEFDVKEARYSILVQAPFYEMAPWEGLVAEDKRLDFQLVKIDPKRHTHLIQKPSEG